MTDRRLSWLQPATVAASWWVDRLSKPRLDDGRGRLAILPTEPLTEQDRGRLYLALCGTIMATLGEVFGMGSAGPHHPIKPRCTLTQEGVHATAGQLGIACPGSVGERLVMTVAPDAVSHDCVPRLPFDPPAETLWERCQLRG